MLQRPPSTELLAQWYSGIRPEWVAYSTPCSLCGVGCVHKRLGESMCPTCARTKLPLEHYRTFTSRDVYAILVIKQLLHNFLPEIVDKIKFYIYGEFNPLVRHPIFSGDAVYFNACFVGKVRLKFVHNNRTHMYNDEVLCKHEHAPVDLHHQRRSNGLDRNVDWNELKNKIKGEVIPHGFKGCVMENVKFMEKLEATRYSGQWNSVSTGNVVNKIKRKVNFKLLDKELL